MRMPQPEDSWHDWMPCGWNLKPKAAWGDYATSKGVGVHTSYLCMTSACDACGKPPSPCPCCLPAPRTCPTPPPSPRTPHTCPMLPPSTLHPSHLPHTASQPCAGTFPGTDRREKGRTFSLSFQNERASRKHLHKHIYCYFVNAYGACQLKVQGPLRNNSTHAPARAVHHDRALHGAVPMQARI